MEELSLSTIEEKEYNEDLCVNCRERAFEHGHAVNLCTTCRTELINYPIPKWIKVFSVCLLIVIVVSLVRTKTYVSAAIDLGKGEKAIENKQYVTAQREIAKVLSKFPDDFTANSDMVIAASYNLDLAALSLSFSRIAEKKTDDTELLNRVNLATDYVQENFVQDTISKKNVDSLSKNPLELTKMLKDSEVPLKLLIANYLFELNDYPEVEKICLEVLKSKPTSYMALSLMSALKRNTNKFDEGIAYCDKILAVNKESVYAISQKARIELKRHHDDQAAIYAALAMKIDPMNDSSLEAMAMVDYFAGRKAKSLETLSALSSHAAQSGDSTILKRLTPIINGTTNYR